MAQRVGKGTSSFIMLVLCNIIYSLILGCSCDPAIGTDDCDESPCIPFLSFFLVAECFVLIGYIVLIVWVEKTKGTKFPLWRIILPSCCIGCLGKKNDN